MLSQPPALGATPTAVQALLYVNQLTRYTTQQQALKDAKTQLLAALNEEALSLIVEPRHGTRRRTIRAIMDILREAYGVAGSRRGDMVGCRAVAILEGLPTWSMCPAILAGRLNLARGWCVALQLHCKFFQTLFQHRHSHRRIKSDGSCCISCSSRCGFWLPVVLCMSQQCGQ